MILSANEILDIRTLSLIKSILQPNLIVSFEGITSALWVNPRLISCLPAAVFEQGTDTMCFLLIFSNLDCYCSMTANHPSYIHQWHLLIPVLFSLLVIQDLSGWIR